MNIFFRLALGGFAILVVWKLLSNRNAKPVEDEAVTNAIAAVFAPKPVEPVYKDKEGKIIRKPDYDLMVGYDTAKERGISSHDDCGRMEGLVRMGCDQYVTEQKIPPYIQQGDFAGGKTTAQCEAEVLAFWDALIQDMREMGARPGDAAMIARHQDRYADLRECENYDNLSALRHQEAQ